MILNFGLGLVNRLFALLTVGVEYDLEQIQGDSFDSSSGNRLLRAYFETSEGLKGIYVTLRLGANYFLVRYTLKWDLE